MATRDNLLIARDYEDISDFPLEHKMQLERDYQRNRADRDFSQAMTCAFGAGGEAIIAAAGAMVGTPVWLLGAAMGAVCAGVAVGRFAQGIGHVAAAFQPDSVLRHTIQQMEASPPGTLVQNAEPQGRIAPGQTAAISQS